MAILTSTNVFRAWADGLSDKAALYALRKVTTGDTFDLSADFSSPRSAAIVGTTVIGSEAATFSGTVVTIPGGLTGDGGYLLVWGVSS